MKLSQLKEGMRVADRWYPWSVGVVEKVLKTRVRIRFGTTVETYDSAHVQFLEAV